MLHIDSNYEYKFLNKEIRVTRMIQRNVIMTEALPPGAGGSSALPGTALIPGCASTRFKVSFILPGQNRASCSTVRDKNLLFPGGLLGVLGSAVLVGRCWLLLARLPGGLCSVLVPGSVSVAAARYMHSTSSGNTLSLPRVVEGS